MRWNTGADVAPIVLSRTPGRRRRHQNSAIPRIAPPLTPVQACSSNGVACWLTLSPGSFNVPACDPGGGAPVVFAMIAAASRNTHARHPGGRAMDVKRQQPARPDAVFARPCVAVVLLCSRSALCQQEASYSCQRRTPDRFPLLRPCLRVWIVSAPRRSRVQTGFRLQIAPARLTIRANEIYTRDVLPSAHDLLWSIAFTLT